jgi:hypothetical protein
MTSAQRRIADEERPTAVCARRAEGGCDGYVQVSHPFGRKIQMRWMWVWICYEHHQGKKKNEQIGRLHAYRQATDEMIKQAFPKTWKAQFQEREWLKSKYKT